MNEHISNFPLRPKVPRRTTQAAEGLLRWRWTLAEFDRMIEVGLLGEDDRVELIDGEIVPMAAKGIRHENVRNLVTNWFLRRLPANVNLYPELGWRPDEAHYLEPDLLLCEQGPMPATVAPAHVLLAIEFARTSIAYDQGTKARTYSLLGVRDYWVINALTLVTRIYRAPAGEAYGEQRELAPAEPLVPLHLPGLALRLADLAIDDTNPDESET